MHLANRVLHFICRFKTIAVAMAAATSGRFVSLFKQGLNEIPEVLAAGVAAVFGVTLASYRLYHYQKNEEWNKVYKLVPVYMRPDDPRVVKVHKP